jgi:ABC-2 type transport system permease protein
MNAFLALTQREIRRFIRQRSRLIGALITPLLFWLLIGTGIGRSFVDVSGQSQGGYLSFFFPGMLLLSVLFTSIFSTISVIEDRHQGFLQAFLVSPQPKVVFLLAKVVGASLLATLQAALLLLAAPLTGYSLMAVNVPGILSLLFVSAATLTTLGFLLAWKIDSVAGYHSMMNVLLMPMWLLSGALFPMKERGPFFEWIAAINPLSYSVSSLRGFFGVQDPHFSSSTSFGNLCVTAAFGLGFLLLSSYFLERKHAN